MGHRDIDKFLYIIYSFHFLNFSSNLICFIEVIKKNIKREMLLICHLWVTLSELHMIVST